MFDWFLLSLVALLLLGSQRFLYKVAAERRCNPALTSAVFMATVALLSVALFFAKGEPAGAPRLLLLLALANSACFALATIGSMEALRRLPAAVTYPLTRLSLVLVVAFSVIYFGERPTPFQWLGVFLGLSVAVVLAGEAGRPGRPGGEAGSGWLWLGLCVLGGAGAAISSKFAALDTSKSAFMALSYLLGTGFSLAMNRRGLRNGGEFKAALRLGVPMGILNFLGFYAFLAALARGPLSLVALLTGMHFVIAIILSALIYRERLTPRRICGIALTLLAVLCLRY